MTGLKVLQQLPTAVQDQITNKYKTIQAFYMHVIGLCQSDYTAHMQKDRATQTTIQNQMWDIEAELESFGLDFMDADYVMSQIRGDNTAVVLVNHLKKIGLA
jgi:hypothetical protein